MITLAIHRNGSSDGGVRCLSSLGAFKKMFDTNLVFHYYCGMKNVTITLDKEVARWARIRAAEEETSVSRLVGELLREKMLNEGCYRSSMQNYLAQSPRLLKKTGYKYPDREALHAR